MNDLSLNPKGDSDEPRRWIAIGDLVEDKEFSDFFKLAADHDPEQARRGDPIVVWPQDGRFLVLLGYAQLPVLKKLGAPVLAMEENFANRADATVFVTGYLIKAYRMTSLLKSYLRGTAYLIASERYDNSEESLPMSVGDAIQRALKARKGGKSRRGGTRLRSEKRRRGKGR